MGKPTSLLELLCGHALSFRAESIHTERREGHQHVFANKNGAAIRIADYAISSRDGKELSENLEAAARKPVRTVMVGKVYILAAQPFDNVGEGAFVVKLAQAYLAFIHHYTKIHRQPPAETDLERFFRVSAPSIHGMIKTLERNGLIEKIPGQARSIRVIVQPEHLPKLD